MTLENKDILQLDATVITGILIFLGVSFITIPPPTPSDTNSGSSNDLPSDYLRTLYRELSTRLLLTLLVITPLTISALIILADEIIIETFRGRRTRSTGALKVYALLASAAGFVSLVSLLGGVLYVVYTSL